ncbi:hypothetical protein ABW19_dt0207962 [Dactylella cylindrospora]|nr:hypothetical protein ABW19_dt0207962 [Dactylella cylindrospora]
MSSMSAPIIRSAAQTIKSVPSAAISVDTTTAAARSAAASTARSSTITTSITQQGGVASRSITTTSSVSSSAFVNKGVMGALRDAARAVDQTSSEGLEKAIELGEEAMKLAKENGGREPGGLVEANVTAKTLSASGMERRIADEIASEAMGAFECLGEGDSFPKSAQI